MDPQLPTRQLITVCAFLHHDGKLLTAKRAHTKKFLPDTFELVGGHVMFGETLEACLIRELKEELKIDIAVGKPFYAFSYLADSNTSHVIEIDFFAQLKNPNQRIILNPNDHSDYAWITPEEIEKYFARYDEEKKAVKRGFELLSLLG